MLALTAQVVGLLLLAAVFLQFLVWLGASVRRALAERERDRMALDLLEQRLEAARIRRQELELERLSWQGYRKFEVHKKVLEADGICSFHLGPHDGRSLSPFRPGQYLTFRLKIPGVPKPTVRCYSVSDRAQPGHYRISVKRIPSPSGSPEAPPGLASSYFHDHVEVHDILDVKAPAGSFWLDLHKQRPVVMIAGGVGVTPLLSMLNAVVANGIPREVWFFYGARHRGELMEIERLEALARDHDWLRLHLCLSRPRSGDIHDSREDHPSRVSLELLKELLPSSNYEFFVCGPPDMMEVMTDGLRGWGVPSEHIHFEAFGAATVRKAVLPSDQAEQSLRVSFSRSGCEVDWRAGAGSLLELAEAEGVTIEFGCRAGNCGTCLAAIRSGEVRYMIDPGAEVDPGTCLTCIAIPNTDVVLDA